MGCGASSAGKPKRMEDVKMRRINRPLQPHEKAVVENIFASLDGDASNDVSDDEFRELFQRFGFETSPQCIAHVGACLRSWESERTNKNAKKVSIDRSTFERWWPSILDYFERVSSVLGDFTAQGEEGFDLLLQPFQDAGFGPALCSDTPLAVDKINNMCRTLGVQFKDSTFATTNQSIGSKLEKHTTWRRISDFIGPKALMFADGTNAGDTVAETYGRNKYAADITSLADRFDLLMTVVYPPRYNPAGVYAVKLQRDGEIIYVVVDDYIPVGSNGLPAFLRSADPKEIWPLIIDKAFAKLKSSYEKLHMSPILQLDPLSLLTGSRSSTLSIPKAVRSKERADIMWSCIKLYMDKHWFMCSSPTSADPASGLILDHWYSVIGYAEDDSGELRLVQVRNPMGTAEWKGAWSDDDDKWKRHPNMAKRCLAVEEDDGGFWISVEDFSSRFGALRCNALLPKETIPIEDFEGFGRNMSWGTAEMSWREAQMYIDDKRKLREEMTHVSRFISTHRGEAVLDGESIMTPFDCPQYRLHVPAGNSCTFYYRGCRVMDEDKDGKDDDEEYENAAEFDAWQYLSKDALQMELPYIYIVRGDSRQTVLPTKHIISSGFSSYTACTLSPGTYTLMMIAFDRPDVNLKLMVRTSPDSAGVMRIKELPPAEGVTFFNSVAPFGLRGLGKYLPTGRADLDARRPPVKEITPYLKISPSGPSIKNLSLTMVMSPRYDAMSQKAGTLYLATLRDVMSTPFQWEALTSKSDVNVSRVMRTIYYSGSGQDFVVLPFLTGESIGASGVASQIPFLIAVWSPQGRVNVSSIQGAK